MVEKINWNPKVRPYSTQYFLCGEITGLELYYRPTRKYHDRTSLGGVRVYAYVENKKHFVRTWLKKITYENFDSINEEQQLHLASQECDDLLGKFALVQAFRESWNKSTIISIKKILQNQDQLMDYVKLMINKGTKDLTLTQLDKSSPNLARGFRT